MLYLLITAVFISVAWLVYSSRNAILAVSWWLLHRRYDVGLSGQETLDPGKVWLVIPNHPAIDDPFIVTTELHRFNIDIRPLVDEAFFSNRLVRHILALFEAVRVPDFRHANFRPLLKARPARVDAARRARSLGYTVLATLTGGGNVLLYPSGHITTDGRERLSNRQLAHNVISRLPDDINVLGVRTRGLYGSMWSRVNGRPPPPFAWTLFKGVLLLFTTPFRPRRRVTVHFEDLTSRCREWAKLDRAAFNAALERWYDADLVQQGRTCEEVT